MTGDSYINVLLLGLAITIPWWYGYRRSVLGGLVEINHVTTFTFGFLFYWITPLAVRILAPHLDFPLARLWSGFFREHLIAPYAAACVALYLCFMLGDWLGTRWFPRQSVAAPRTVPALALSLVMVCGCGLLIYSAYAVRADLFRPAAPGAMQVGVARGAVTACVVLLGCVALIFAVQHSATPWSRLLASRYFVPPILGGGVMLLLGSRLYIASLVLIFLIYQTNFRAKLKLKRVLAVALLFAVFFGAVGTWREGSSLSGSAFNILLEPMEVSLSLVHHLRYQGMAWTNAPTQLVSDLVNLVPTILVPGKLKLLKQPGGYRPLGGMNSFVSFNLNFGILGTAAVFVLFPIFFRYLRSRMTNTLQATIYLMCSGWLAFTFFRDPFSISIVKLMFEDSIVFPVMIVCFGQLLDAACAPADASFGLLADPQQGNA